MPQRRIRLRPSDAREIESSFAELRKNLDVSLEFPADVLADADASVATLLPDEDETAIPFLTIDPPESMDLDQALHVERAARATACATRSRTSPPSSPRAVRWTVEAHAGARPSTRPDQNARLYPPQLSEGAGSLLPDETRPAVLWTMDVDETGEGVEVDVRRALVRSREKLDYEGVQRSLDDGTADETLRCCARSACCGRSGRPARRHQPPDPRAGGRPGRRTGTSSPSARRSRSRAGTRRSRSWPARRRRS